MVAYAGLSCLPVVAPYIPRYAGPHPRRGKTGQVLNKQLKKPGTFPTGHRLPAKRGFAEGPA